LLAVRTPGAPQTARVDAAFGSAFPFERQGRLLRSRSISGLYSRSLHSGLQPPCLRFAAAVTGRHARLGSRLLAWLCRGRHRRRQTSTRLQGATLIKPDEPISGIRLSDWLHREVHGEQTNRTRLHPHEFIRRFLIRVLPKGFHRIRQDGLFANRAENVATARALLNVAPPATPQEPPDIDTDTPRVLPCPCPRCGGRMIVIEVFARGCEPSWRSMPSRINTS
jgi:hypothetical protein